MDETHASINAPVAIAVAQIDRIERLVEAPDLCRKFRLIWFDCIS